jgi:hypothetical protein
MSPVIILSIVIILVIILLVYFFSPKVDTNQVGPSTVFPMRPSTTITPSDSNILNNINNTFTLSFFVQLVQPKQIVSASPVSSNNTIYKIVQFQNSWSIDFIGLPDASRQNDSYIQFTNSAEPISSKLPPIPFQQWIHIAIIRDSRRFDVCYNGKVVFSQIYSKNSSKGGSLIFGSDTDFLSGKFTNIVLSSSVKTIEDIKKQYNSLSDTNGLPYTDALIKFPTFSDILSTKYMPAIPVIKTGAPPPGMALHMPYS